MGFLDRWVTTPPSKGETETETEPNSDDSITISHDQLNELIAKAIDKRQADDVEDQRLKLEEHNKTIAHMRDNVNTLASEFNDSPEPFVAILSDSYDPELGLKVSLDYNDAFIQSLRDQGVGREDQDADEIIRIWMAHLADDIMRDDDVINEANAAVKTAEDKTSGMLQSALDIMGKEERNNVDN